jgi:hypothetical protein
MRAQASPSPISSRRFLAVVVAALVTAACALPAPVVASPPAAGDGSVECKLPPQIRSLGRTATYLAAGRVVHVPVAECKVRGGTWSGGGPGAYAGAGEPTTGGPIAVTVGGESGAPACPLKGTVGGLSKGSTLSVRAGPGTAFARLDRLAGGSRVFLCDRSGETGWVGIVYGGAGSDCGLAAPITPPRAYAGTCRAGWVRSDYLR